MQGKADLPIHLFETAAEWRGWLQHHQAETHGVWLRIAKKASDKISLSYEEAVEVALCFGWIDGQVRRDNEDFYLQRFTPRRSKSSWSQSNIARAKVLIQAGKMQPAGQAAIDAAKADGRWDQSHRV